MPYGLEKKYNTPKHNAWMEKCVKSVMKSDPDYDKSRAIAVCKTQIKQKGKSEEWMEEEISEVSLRNIEDMFYKALNVNDMQPVTSYAYPVDIFDEYAIISRGDKYFKVPYTMGDSEITIDWTKATEVVRKVTYEGAEYVSKPTHVRKKITNGMKTI